MPVVTISKFPLIASDCSVKLDEVNVTPAIVTPPSDPPLNVRCDPDKNDAPLAVI